MKKILIDTNILIYSIDKDSKYFQQSHNLLLDSNLQLFTTSKNLSEFMAVITRYPGKSLAIDDALIIIEDFSKVLSFLYPNPVSLKIFKKLLVKHKPAGLLIHDFEIASIAIAHDITHIATLNSKDFDLIDELCLYSLK